MDTLQNTINRSTLRPLFSGFVRMIVYALLVVGLAEFIKWDASQFVGDAKFSEASYTEIMQSVLLAGSTLLLLYVFLTKLPLRYTALLMLGLTGAALIREQDIYFETYLGNSSWQIPVYFLLAVVIYNVVKNFVHFSRELRVHVQSTSFGVFLGGLLTTFVFSRLYGRKSFWYEVMGEQYFRAVKNAGEECLELYGYLLVFIAAIELTIMCLRIQKMDLERSFNEIRQLLDSPLPELSKF